MLLVPFASDTNTAITMQGIKVFHLATCWSCILIVYIGVTVLQFVDVVRTCLKRHHDFLSVHSLWIFNAFVGIGIMETMIQSVESNPGTDRRQPCRFSLAKLLEKILFKLHEIST